MANIKSINGQCYEIESSRVKKLADLPINVAHSWDPNPTRYGSFVVEVLNMDTDETCRCYMPKYIAGRGSRGKMFVYEGLENKSDGSGHSFHKVVFLKQKK